jgi:hypothetical protein
LRIAIFFSLRSALMAAAAAAGERLWRAAAMSDL